MNLTEEIINGGLISLLKKINEENIIKIENNKIYYISTLSNQNKEINSTFIDLGNCEDILKINNNINLTEELIIFKIENYINGITIPIIEYEIYSKDGTKKLDLNICNNTILYNIPININESDIFKYDPESNFYNI